MAALVLLINGDLSLLCVPGSGLVSPLLVGITPPIRGLFSDEFSAKANSSMQRVVSAAEKPQIVDRCVAARRPRPDVIEFEKIPRLAAPAVC